MSMKGLCCDCNIGSEDGDKNYIGTSLKCNYITRNNIVGQTEEHIDQFSFLLINNCFTHLSFSVCPRSIYGGTPAEVLHAVLLGLYEYIAVGIELTLTASEIDMISYVVVGR